MYVADGSNLHAALGFGRHPGEMTGGGPGGGPGGVTGPGVAGPDVAGPDVAGVGVPDVAGVGDGVGDGAVTGNISHLSPEYPVSQAHLQSG